MKRGIQAQLFFGFGGLILVIGLFYSRLTFLFIDVTKDATAAFVMEQYLAHLPDHPTLNDGESSSEYHLSVISSDKLMALGTIASSTHDDHLFRFENQTTSGYLWKIDDKTDTTWLLMNTQQVGPLGLFSSIFNVFFYSISAAVIGLTVVSTWFIAKRLSVPIQNLTRSVFEQKPNDEVNISEVHRQDEIGQLAQTFEQTYTDLQQAWKREHDFASDVSHELRTPIALIRNTLALNPTGEIPADDRQLLEQATATLQNTVEVLLTLARKENLVFTSQTFLPHIERAVLAVYQAHDANDFDIQLALDEDLSVVGNENLIALLCQNLINNGFYHGGGHHMRVYTDAQRIVFENPITPNTKHTNYQGLGHGQYLTQRMAHVMGWQIEFEDDEQRYRAIVTPV